MTSELKITANRLNSLASTGPRTVQGKLASRGNAMKHAIRAADVVVGALGESKKEYNALLASLQEDLQPQGALESALVEKIAACLWRQRRILHYEQGVIAEEAAALALQEARESVFPLGPGSHPWPDLWPREAPLTSSQMMDLHRLLSDVRASIKEKGTLSQAYRDKLDDGFGIVRGGVALLCAAHVDMAQEARDNGDLPAAERHVARALSVVDEERERLQDLVTEVWGIERDARKAKRTQAVVPGEAALAKILRYEAALDRQLHRTLGQLERLQRQRQGDTVPPPLQLDLTMT